MKQLQRLCLAFFLTFLAQWLSAQNNPWVGQNIDGTPTAANIAAAQLRNGGRHIDIIEHWADWNHDPFSTLSVYLDAIYNNGSIMELGFQPQDGTAFISNAQINNGQYDAFLHQYAKDVAAWGKPIWFRLMHEMNADWYGWSPGVNGNTSASFINAWHRVVDIFRSEGANNVKWVYSVAQESKGSNTFTSMYPGDDYVDYNSIDLYNWGTSHPDWPSAWQSFNQCISAVYSALAPIGKPINISEWGCVEVGGSKANWITDGYNQIRNSGNYNLIQAAIWFDTNYTAPGNQDDFRINSSAASLNAYIAATNFTSPPVPGTNGDTQAPSVPTGLASSGITQTGFTLTWAASTDNTGVTGYEVFRNGTSIGTPASTSFNITGLTCNTAYSMKVRARDAAGNWSAQSTALNVTTSACTGSGANLALNKPATASSFTGTNIVSNAFDGNATTTRWESDYTDPSWIYVDLGSSTSINRVVLKWETAYADQYKIQVSQNASTWTDVFSTTTGNGATDDISFTTTNARYVRMYGIHRGTAYAYSLWEFEVYGAAGGALRVANVSEISLIKTSSISLYPNPLYSGSELYLSFKSFNNEDMNVTFFDMSGRVVYKDRLKAVNDEIVKVPVKLAKGLYLVTLKSKSEIKQQKFVVQ